jgi:calcineurin-like phosphoesterase family protein
MEFKEFLTSDSHFGHRNIIKYCDRPFWSDKEVDPSDEDVHNMNETMIENWNRVVSANDVIYHLGDFAFLSKEKLKELRKRLNGRIRLIMGNHDYYYGYKFLQDLDFDRVYDKPIIWHQFFIMSHEPIFLCVENNHTQKVSQGVNDLKKSGLMHCINLHGHIHQISYNDPHYFNACVELHNYTPIDLLELEQKYISMNQ